MCADKSAERVEKAMEIRHKLGIYNSDGSSKNNWAELSPAYAESIIEYCFGMIWNQPLLDLKTREIIVIVTGATQNIPQVVEDHTMGALNVGLTREEIIEAIVQCSPYIGLPKTNHALKAAKRAFERMDNKAPAESEAD
ncbi:MAG: carboxymuconolactone decarboxylase family protein [Nitrospinaceae bacterium]|jgi:4-carboxymuconolactone decarboxylase|nr:carboxymuconolactone decarboxylase family protein [Nitrospinaceae bacterium]MBT3820878.1 carboxymuconolactone decarboxylase family protein [Nitrospinaceae bacterium]MBT4431527.1 carboxymuconolactone decarboxylase family protein [Nitrospinaceae bacterium]MBT5368166.1 carboxymuconolactone decarboxylase family protein [Nitrospinaceae bacterium]MBT6393359.1 carboxymuconolactone decarboxylase family protein [Nitrospinaceae bacterium]